jgi:hypothetical protein
LKKLYIALSIILSLCFIFAGCDVDIEDETISVSGDVAYYAEMDEDTLKEKCEGNYIEVSGTVHIIYQNIGTIYLGNSLSDKIQFSCDLSNSDDATNIEKGDLITIRGKCSSCIGSTIYLKNCEVEKQTNQTELESTTPTNETTTTPTTESSTTPTIEPTTAPTTEPPHTHNFNAATCTTPKTCSCGTTEGEANGHNWKDATCSDPKTCTVCGTTSGLTAGHNFSNGKCTTCGKADPDYNHETMVWIPTNGGTKYHTHAGCSNMEDPEQVTQSEAESRGFTPCKRCH